MTAAIDDDERRGVIAQWHDESHWNAYLSRNAPTLWVHPSAVYGFGGDDPTALPDPWLTAVVKGSVFDIAELRGLPWYVSYSETYSSVEQAPSTPQRLRDMVAQLDEVATPNAEGHELPPGDARFTILPKVRIEEIEGETVLADLEKGRFLAANQVTMFVWRAVENGASLDECTDELCETYDVDRARAEADVRAIAAKLHAAGSANRASRGWLAPASELVPTRCSP